MQVTKVQRGTAAVVSIAGSVDAMTAPQLLDLFKQQIAAGRNRWVADLAGLNYTSSAGMHVLLAAAKLARGGGGDLRLAGLKPNVKKLLDLSGLASSSAIRMFPRRLPASTSGGHGFC